MGRSTQARAIARRLQAQADPQRAKDLQWFFKTGPGEYGQGDVFRGLRVPQVRAIVKEFKSLATLADAVALLPSKYHEDRLAGLLLMVELYARGDPASREEVYATYLANTDRINNWDLVDLSAHKIVGRHLDGKSKRELTRLAKSSSLWERRIAVLATFHEIAAGRFREPLRIARMLLKDPEDLIHKAVGWMLREVGKRDLAAEEAFLKTHYLHMPRTMLRYAIEKFPEQRRQAYLKGTV